LVQGIQNENIQESLSLYRDYPFEPLKFEKHDGILFQQWVEKAKQFESKQKAPAYNTSIDYKDAFNKFLEWTKRYTYEQKYPKKCEGCKCFSYEVVDQYPNSYHSRKKKVYYCKKKRCKLKNEWWEKYI